jgi:hypothetical protein
MHFYDGLLCLLSNLEMFLTYILLEDALAILSKLRHWSDVNLMANIIRNREFRFEICIHVMIKLSDGFMLRNLVHHMKLAWIL